VWPIAGRRTRRVAKQVAGRTPSSASKHGAESAAVVTAGRTVTTGPASNAGVDDDERQALRAEGLNPDDPAVIAAINLVRWELSLAT
jgi:hypothetical protein